MGVDGITPAQPLEFPGRTTALRGGDEGQRQLFHRGWVIGGLGQEGQLIPPAYVKPFVKR